MTGYEWLHFLNRYKCSDLQLYFIHNNVIPIEVLRIINIYVALPSSIYFMFLNIFICKARIINVNSSYGSSHMPNSRTVIGLSLTFSFHKCKMVLSVYNGVQNISISQCSTQATVIVRFSVPWVYFARQSLKTPDFSFIFLIREPKLLAQGYS